MQRSEHARCLQLVDLPEVCLDEPRNDRKTDAVVLKAGEMLDSLVPLADGLARRGATGRFKSIRIQLDPPAEKIDLNQLLEEGSKPIQEWRLHHLKRR